MADDPIIETDEEIEANAGWFARFFLLRPTFAILATVLLAGYDLFFHDPTPKP